MDESMFDVPIPGSSLTKNTEQLGGTIKSPEYTNVDRATEYLFDLITGEEMLPDILEQIRKGIPLEVMAQVILFFGFTEGKWNPDLLILLIEPAIYTLIYVAEQANIDPVIYEGQENDLDLEDKKTMLDTKNIVRNKLPPGLMEKANV